MQLDRIDAQIQGSLDLRGLGIEEKGDFQSRLATAIDRRADSRVLADDVESALGGQLFAPLGNQGDLIRHEFDGQGNN